MCGRYEFTSLSTLTGKQIKERAEKLQLNYACGEIFPGNQVLCIIPRETKIDLATMKWGIQGVSYQINARYEALDTRAFYQDLKKRRCAVIANGFYEWDENKQKHYVCTKDDYIYLACIFNDKNELLIITREADEDFAQLHNRIPIIMNKNEMLDYIHGQDRTITKKKLIIEKKTIEQTSLF